MTIRQEIEEKMRDDFSVMFERAGRENGERPEEWEEKLEVFIFSTVIPMVIEKIVPEEIKLEEYFKEELSCCEETLNNCRQSILSKLKEEGLNK